VNGSVLEDALLPVELVVPATLLEADEDCVGEVLVVELVVDVAVVVVVPELELDW
jgi:hypothetical protein